MISKIKTGTQLGPRYFAVGETFPLPPFSISLFPGALGSCSIGLIVQQALDGHDVLTHVLVRFE